MVYNKADTAYWRSAQRIKNATETLFVDLDKELQRLSLGSQAQASGETEINTSEVQLLDAVGDLEPSLELLNLLVSEDVIRQDANMDLMFDKPPIDALLSYEIAKPKPAPPVSTPVPVEVTPSSPPRPPSPLAGPSTPPPQPQTQPQQQVQPPSTPHKRDRKAEKERRRLAREAALKAPPSLRAPRTRHALAIAAAFEAEVAGPSEPREHDEQPAEQQQTEPPETEGEGGAVSATPEAGAEAAVKVPSKRKHRHKRDPIILPGQSEVPPVVDNVDEQRWFSNFDVGWILPNDHRRGGRPPTEKAPLPEPRRKKPRTGRLHSDVSMLTLILIRVVCRREREVAVLRGHQSGCRQRTRRRSIFSS